MRALFYVGDDGWSGSARAMLAAARGLAARNHSTTIAARGGTRIERLAIESGLEVARIDAGKSAPATFKELRQLLQERPIDVAFVTNERDQLIVGRAARGGGGRGVIRRVPSFTKASGARGGRLGFKSAPAGLLFTSDVERDAAPAGGWPIPPSVAPLGVDVAAYDAIQPASRPALRAPAQALLIGCVYDSSGRLRIATLFRALALLIERHPNLHVVVLGPGTGDQDLRMHAAALGVNSFVTFLGERDDDLATLRAADVGWVVASGDGGAYGFLDCMAMRIPVIAERTPLAQHYVADGITGTLLSSADPAQTASAVAAFLANSARRVAMGNASRTRVQRDFPETAMVEGFERAGQLAGDLTKGVAR